MDTDTADEPEVKPPSLEEQKDYILQNFDFRHVHHVMRLLDWEWSMETKQRVPSFEEVFNFAEKELQNLIEHENLLETYCGGFLLSKIRGVLTMAFCVERVDCSPD